MKSTFDLLKNGKSAQTVWANPTTKDIVMANRNPFGWNYFQQGDEDFRKKYGYDMKSTQGKGSNYHYFYHSAKSMVEAGFQLVKRGDSPLW